MEFDVPTLFRDVADLPPDERERYFDRLQVPPEIRAEVTSLCSFDVHNQSLTSCISEIASEMLTGSAPAAGTACGPYTLVRLLGTDRKSVV